MASIDITHVKTNVSVDKNGIPKVKSIDSNGNYIEVVDTKTVKNDSTNNYIVLPDITVTDSNNFYIIGKILNIK